jgi:hypothetical protein
MVTLARAYHFAAARHVALTVGLLEPVKIGVP